ncbi:FAD-dependent monooxygenase [Nocardiopsis sp. EMB25]|uniref:FAD-dependent monooxygenase n=1 Tax=Nocardiopsis sp. EMB25 TaxID=2835867 RepID=UPI002283840C|nr:FAD-dependent monooxygenase [Nocardiopsis sp. EMB25]MCY9783682.1 FAD-dependent monooxygenase [Nocardiopsis sp. EMB25]
MRRLVVVGAGPVGLTAALAARHRGLDVSVVEADPRSRARPGSRAIFVHRESLRALDRISPGLGLELAGLGLVWGAKRTLWAGREVYARVYGPSRGPFPPFSSLPQSLLEERLRWACDRVGVGVHWGARVTGVVSGADGVAVRTEGGQIEGTHVIAADGARSVVREAVGIALAGSSSGTDFVVVDVHDAKRPLRAERVLHYRHPAVDGRNVLLVPFRGGWRIDLQCAGERESAAFAADPDTWVPDVLPGHRVAWVSRYRFHQRVAERFVDEHGRVLLAGDAAHLFPPFGARGMNSGVADAVAAVDAVAEGGAQEYAMRRRAAAVANCAAAGQACAHLLARTWPGRVRQRAAALAAPVWEPAGRWLDTAAFGPRIRRVRY